MKHEKEYLPHKRDFLENTPSKDKVEDDVVCNNISYVEFDYTYNGGDDILYDCCNNNHSEHHGHCKHHNKEEKHNCECKHKNHHNNCECK